MRMTRIILILPLLLIISISSCSLFPTGRERRVGSNSICWDDNDHILIYANITAYYDEYNIGGVSKEYVWGGGEIWKINVSTGEKELLMRKKGAEYYQEPWLVRITKSNKNYYLSGNLHTYKIKEDFSGWDEFGDYIYPVFSSNSSDVVGVTINDEVRKYYLLTGEEELLYCSDEIITNMDYDFDRNLLLLNNIRLINLNTGTDTVLLYHGEEISGYKIYDPYAARYGNFSGDNIIIDVYSTNTVYSKVYIDTDSISNRTLRYGLRGVPNSDGTRFAFAVDNGVEIQNENGTVITKLIFDSSGL